MESPSSRHLGGPSDGPPPGESHPGRLLEDPRRKRLMEMIATGFNSLVPEGLDTAIESLRDCYGSLWLSDLEKLESLVTLYLPHNPSHLLGVLKFMEEQGSITDRWTQKDKRPESRAPSGPATPVNTEAPSTILSSPAVSAAAIAGQGSSPNTPRLRVVTLPSSPGQSGKGRKRKGEPMDQPTKPPRSEVAEQNCRLRDQACILTKCRADMCAAAHLYPYRMSHRTMKGVKQFFNTLREFWSAEKVEAWYKAIYEPIGGTERPENLILLSPDAHALHTRGFFALEPVEQDAGGKWLVVKFWWLKQHKGVDFNIPPQLPSDQDPTEYAVGLLNMLTNKPICSGEPIRLETPDPKNYPLPDFQILEMQWYLKRVLALRGGAEPKDLVGDESDEDFDDRLPYLLPEFHSSRLPGRSSPPSSITNAASEEGKANPVVAATETLPHQQVEE